MKTGKEILDKYTEMDLERCGQDTLGRYTRERAAKCMALEWVLADNGPIQTEAVIRERVCGFRQSMTHINDVYSPLMANWEHNLEFDLAYCKALDWVLE